MLAGLVWAADYDFTSEKLFYKIVDQNAVQLVGNDISSSKEYSISVIIPKTITYKKKNYTVVGIADSAFAKCVKLKSVSIPESVTSIGFLAFEGCSGLTSVTIPNSLTSIGAFAFVDCENLMSVIIPNNTISDINEGTFYGCLRLESISIPASVISIGAYAFAKCTNLKSVTIPESVTNIGTYAFTDCKNLISITIPKSVKSIERGAFGRCTNLKSVTIPESVTSMEAFAFYNCVNLKSVTIPNTISEICEGTFGECSKLESVSIPNSILKIGRFAFYACNNLSDVNIPNTVKEIEDSAFIGCNIITVNIPSSVEKIGKNAFAHCYNLTQVKIPASVKMIGEDAFSGCPKIKSVYCEVKAKPIGWDAYWIADEPSSKTFTRSEIIQWGGVDYSGIDQVSEQSEMLLVGRLGYISVRIGKPNDKEFFLLMSLHDDIEWPLDGRYLVVWGDDYASFEKNMAIVNEKFAKWTQTAKTDGEKNFRKTIVDFGDKIGRMSLFNMRGTTKLYAVFEVDENGECLLKFGSQEIDDSQYAYSNYAPYYTFYSPEDFRKFYEIIKYDNAMKNYKIMKSKLDAKKKAIEDRDAKFD